MIDLKNRIIFIHIPKTGGTSVEAYFQNIRNIEKSELPALGVFINEKSSALERQNGHNSLSVYEKYYFGGPIPEDFKIISVVRDPYARFVSEYNSRRLPPPRRSPINFALPLSLLIHFANNPLTRLKDLNSHLRPQHTYLSGLSQDRVRILRFENLNADFSQLIHELKLPVFDLPRKNVSKKRKPPNRERALAFVADYYAEDYIRLGYDPPK